MAEEKKKDLEKNTGRIVYIEPNNLSKYGRRLGSQTAIPHSYEDYCTSVDLTVLIPDINSCGMPENNGYSEITYSTSKNNISFIGGTDGYLTTNYTDVDLSNPKTNTTECLGIESIEISHQNWFTPLITINFVDIRGASLFLPEEQALYNTILNEDPEHRNINNINGGSFFKALFSFPSPLFKLKVKGYYGKEVTYKLAMSNFKGSFDANNGNFRITCTFVGYLYGIFTDLPLTYLIVSPYINNVGNSYWHNHIEDKFKFKTSTDNDGTPMLAFPQMSKKIETVENDAKKVINDSEEATKYKEAKNILKTLSSIDFRYGNTIKKTYDSISSWNYNEYNGEKFYYYITTTQSEFNEIHEKEYEKYEKMESIVTEVNEARANSLNSLSDIKENFEGKLLLSACHFDVKEIKTTKDYTENDKTVKKQVTEYKATPSKGQTISDLIKEYPCLPKIMDENGILIGYNEKANYSIFKVHIQKDHFNEIQSLIKSISKEVSDYKEKLDKIYTDYIKDNLGFDLSIENVFNLVFAHIETFMACFYNCLYEIDSSKGERTFKALGIKVSDTDNNESKIKEDTPLPPFSLFTKVTEEDGKQNREYVFPTKFNDSLSSLPEVRFVNSIINATKLFEKGDYSKLPLPIEKRNESQSFGIIPTTFYDVVNYNKNNNPYLPIYNQYSNLGNKLADYIAFIFLTRCYYFTLSVMGINNELDNNNNVIDFQKLRAFGYCEAYNLVKALKGKGKTLINDIYTKLTEYFRSHDNRLELLKKASSEIGFENSFEFYPDNTVKFNTLTSKDIAISGCTSSGDTKYIPMGDFEKNTLISDYKTGACGLRKDKKYVHLFSEGINDNECSTYINVQPGQLSELYSGIGDIEASKYDEYGTKSINVYSELYEVLSHYMESVKILDDSQLLTGSTSSYIDCIKTSNLPTEDMIKNCCVDKDKLVCVNGAYNTIRYNSQKNRLKFSDELFDEIYNIQNSDYARAYLLLYSLKTENDLFLYTHGKCTGIIPNLDLLKEGAFYWRYDLMKEGVNIKATINKFSDVSVLDVNVGDVYTVLNPAVKEGKEIGEVNEFIFGKIENIDDDKLIQDYYQTFQCISGTSIVDYDRTNLTFEDVDLSGNVLTYYVWENKVNPTLKNKFKASLTRLVDSGTTLYPAIRINGKFRIAKFEPEQTVAYLDNYGFIPYDIVYTTDDPIELNGKAYHAKRNEVYVSSNYNARGLQLHQVMPSNSSCYALNGIYYKIDVDESISVSRREKARAFFIDWVDNNVSYLGSFFEFEKALLNCTTDEYLKNDTAEGDTKATYTIISSKPDYNYQVKVANVIATSSAFIDLSNFKEYDAKIDMEYITFAFTSFFNCLEGICDEYVNDDSNTYSKEEATNDGNIFNSDDLSLTVYLTLKNMYDRWICNIPFEHWKIGDTRCVFNQFVFMDNYYRKIGQKLKISPSMLADKIELYTQNTEKSETNLETQQGKNVYYFLSSIAQDNGCLFLSVPLMFGVSSSSSMVDMFDTKPFSTNTLEDTSSFAIIYTHKPSNKLNNPDSSKKNDGFDIADSTGEILDSELPDVFTDVSEDNYVIPAFGVTYGKGNQSYFTNISINTDAPKITSQSIQLMLNVTSNASKSARSTVTVGQDMFRIFSNYSYCCDVTMMGDMQITPLMYFQLNNIPLWKGAYQIIDVKHSVGVGKATTQFKGVRIDKNAMPFQNGEILVYNPSLDWDDEFGLNDSDNTIYSDEAIVLPSVRALSTDADNNKMGLSIHQFNRCLSKANSSAADLFSNGNTDKNIYQYYCAASVAYLARYYAEKNPTIYTSIYDGKERITLKWGNANSPTLRENLVRKGYTIYGSEYHLTKKALSDTLSNKSNFRTGDVVCYWKDGYNNPSHGFHTQIYYDKDKSWYSYWKQGDADFVYKNGSWDKFTLYILQAPSQGTNDKTTQPGYVQIPVCATDSTSVNLPSTLYQNTSYVINP